ncbi:MAG TPA: hypothetical protein VFL64_20840 [Rhizobacter sp.]|nr:hypothetical protein [Rhizobacter sp.]
MIVYVSSAEMEDCGITFRRHAGVPDVAHVTLPRIPGSDDLIRLITAPLPGHGSLYLLIINCHGVNQPDIGNVGLKLGSGPLSETGLLTRSSLPIFSALAPFFSERNQGIEVHGCQIARGLEGRLYCQALANASQAKVYAGLDPQVGAVLLHPDEPRTGSTAPALVDDDSSGFWLTRALGGWGPDSWGYFEGPVLCFEPGALSPHDASADLAARSAWRSGTPILPTPHDVDVYELEVPLAPADTD